MEERMFNAFMNHHQQELGERIMLTTHHGRRDQHFSEFLLEIFLYEVAANIPTSKPSAFVRFDDLHYAVTIASSSMKSYGEDPEAPNQIPSEFYGLYINTAPYAPTPRDVYVYLKDEWRVSRLFKKEVTLDRTETNRSQFPLSCSLPSLTPQDHEEFQKLYSKVKPEFQDRFAAIVYGCRKYAWHHQGSGGAEVKTYGLWKIEKYTSKFNAELRRKWDMERTAAATAIIPRIPKTWAELMDRTNTAATSQLPPVDVNFNVNGDESTSSGAIGEKSKSTKKKKTKKKAAAAATNDTENTSVTSEETNFSSTTVKIPSTTASSASLVTRTAGSTIPTPSPTPKTSPSTSPTRASPILPMLPEMPPPVRDTLRKEVTEALESCYLLGVQMAIFRAKGEYDAIEVIYFQWAALHAFIMEATIGHFNDLESRRKFLLERARCKAVIANIQRGEKETQMEVRLKNAIQQSWEFNLAQDLVRHSVKLARARAIRKAAGKQSGKKENGGSTTARPTAEQNRDIPAILRDLDFFLDEYVRLFCTMTTAIPYKNAKANNIPTIVMAAARKEAKSIIMTIWNPNLPLRPALLRFLDTAVLETRIPAGIASQLIKFHDEASLEEKQNRPPLGGNQFIDDLVRSMDDEVCSDDVGVDEPDYDEPDYDDVYNMNGYYPDYGHFDDEYDDYGLDDESLEYSHDCRGENFYGRRTKVQEIDSDDDGCDDMPAAESTSTNNRNKGRRAEEIARQAAKEETERVAREEEAKRVAKKEAERAAREKELRVAREEKERTAREERERIAREEAERIAREKAERVAREEAERVTREAERVAQEAERVAREAERAAREAERIAREKAERIARAEAERIARKEAGRIALEKAEQVAEAEAKRIAMEKARKLVNDEAERAILERGERVLQYTIAEIERSTRAKNKRIARENAAEAIANMAKGVMDGSERQKLNDFNAIMQSNKTSLIALREEANRAVKLEYKCRDDRTKVENSLTSAEELLIQAHSDKLKTNRELAIQMTARDEAWRGGIEEGEKFDQGLKQKLAIGNRTTRFITDQQSKIAAILGEAAESAVKTDLHATCHVLRKRLEYLTKEIEEWHETSVKSTGAFYSLKTDVEGDARFVEEMTETIKRTEIIIEQRRKEAERKEAERMEAERMEAERIAEEKAQKRRQDQIRQDRILALRKGLVQPAQLPGQQITFDVKGINLTLRLWEPPTSVFSTMDQQISDRHLNILPTQDITNLRIQFLERLQQMFNEEYPDEGLVLKPFGSFITGLGSKSSDLDICVVCSSCQPFNARYSVQYIARFLIRNNMKDVIAIADAKVPIVKFKDNLTGIACDMNVHYPLGIYNSQLIRSYLDIDERLGRFLFVLKDFAKIHGIVDASAGFLSSYAYTIMAIVFFQDQKGNAILPRLQLKSAQPRPYNERGVLRNRVAKFENCQKDGSISTVSVEQEQKKYDCTFDTRIDLYKSYGFKNTKTVAQLLFEFFEFYSRKFDYRTSEVSALMGRVQERYSLVRDRKQVPLFNIPTSRNPYTYDDKREIWLSVSEQRYFADLDRNGGVPTGAVPIPGTFTAPSIISVSNLMESSTRNTSTGPEFLCVMDPFMHNRNVAGTCRGEKLIKVWKCFDYAYRCMALGDLDAAFTAME
ncbi:hypothetical protein BGX27_008023 [Mortierella sp. AM989]|nr:hypothetical protein BGX27_008023 [Mortierella sp. AM989]